MNELLDWERRLAVIAAAHVTEHTVIRHHWYPADERVTVTFEGADGGSHMTLFLPRAELVRLRDTLTAMIAEFDTVSKTVTKTDPKTGPERTSSADPGVSSSAA